MFYCLVSRAIHLVLVRDRRTETFMRAFSELRVFHTEPSMCISDNEGSFHAAEKVLKKIAELPEVKQEMIDKNIVWKFLLSRASWMGGCTNT